MSKTTELAEKLDVTPTYISNLEQGKNTMSILVFQKITEALNVSADWLLRANTPELAQISDAEITALLEDCDAEEREMLISGICPDCWDESNSVSPVNAPSCPILTTLTMPHPVMTTSRAGRSVSAATVVPSKAMRVNFSSFSPLFAP